MTCAHCGAQWRPRDEIGGHRLREMVSRDGLSQVFHAVDPAEGKTLALRIISPPFGATLGDTERFTTTVNCLATRDHPHWMRVFGGGMEDDVAWLAMEWMPDGSLAQRGRVGEMEALSAAAQIADALAAAHACGMEHHNLQIGECFLANDGSVKVGGFAEAIFFERAGREVGAPWGLLSCAPPERVFDEPEDARSEIYALGVILFQMLTGELPFGGETMPELLVEELDDPSPRLGDLAPGIQESTRAIVERMLAVDPAQRVSSWDEMAEILRREVETLSQVTSPGQNGAGEVPVTRRAVKAPVYSAAGGAWLTISMLAGIVAFAGWYGWKHFREAPIEDVPLASSAAVAPPRSPVPTPAKTSAPVGTVVAKSKMPVPSPSLSPPKRSVSSMDWSAWTTSFLESPKRPGIGKGDTSVIPVTGALRMTGNNSGMAGENDECIFYAREIAGDWTLTARLSVNNGAAGIAARDSLGSDRPCVGIFVGADGKLKSALRLQPAAPLEPAPVEVGAGSKWMRIARRGTAISAFHSADGKRWREAATLNLPGLSASVPVGFSVWSGVTEKRAGAIFEDIALEMKN